MSISEVDGESVNILPSFFLLHKHVKRMNHTPSLPSGSLEKKNRVGLGLGNAYMCFHIYIMSLSSSNLEATISSEPIFTALNKILHAVSKNTFVVEKALTELQEMKEKEQTNCSNANYLRIFSLFKDGYDVRAATLRHLGTIRPTDEPYFVKESTSEVPLCPNTDDLPEDSWAFKLTRNPSLFYSIFRLLPSEFVTFMKELKEAINGPRKLEKFDKEESRGRHRTLCPSDELLVWLLVSDSDQVALLSSILFGVHKKTLFEIHRHLTNCVWQVYQGEIDWPDEEERELCKGMLISDHNAILLVDGTHCEIECPRNNEDDDLYFNFKKTHSQFFLVWIDYLKFIRRVDGPFPGSRGDRGAINDTLMKEDLSKLFQPDEVILADGGFRGEGPFAVPFTMPIINSQSNNEMKDALIWYNTFFGKERSINEHIMHEIKDRSRSLRDVWRREKELQAHLFKATCAFLNRIRRLRHGHCLENRP